MARQSRHDLSPRPEEGTRSRRTPPASDTGAPALSASHASLGPKDAGTHSSAPIHQEGAREGGAGGPPAGNRSSAHVSPSHPRTRATPAATFRAPHAPRGISLTWPEGRKQGGSHSSFCQTTRPRAHTAEHPVPTCTAICRVPGPQSSGRHPASLPLGPPGPHLPRGHQ